MANERSRSSGQAVALPALAIAGAAIGVGALLLLTGWMLGSVMQPWPGWMGAAPAAAPMGVGMMHAPAPGIAPAVVVPGSPEVTVIGNDFSFEPRELRLTAGQPLTVRLGNQGRLPHDLVVDGASFRIDAGPGEQAAGTLTTDPPGTYVFYCSLPGHREAGMLGTLIVEGGDGSLVDEPQAASQAETADHTSHATLVPASTRGNQLLDSYVDGNVRVFELRAQHVRWEVLPGEYVDAYAYNGQVPGPVIRVTEGEKLRVSVANELAEPTVVHFHGPRLPNEMDGVPGVTQDVIAPGESFSYEFVADPAGVFLYHTHYNSAVQEPKGLYGLFIVESSETEQAYDLDIYQVLSEHSGYFLINGKAFPQTEPYVVKMGQRVRIRLANLGQVDHPMHLHGHSFRIVATDGCPVRGEAWTKDTVNVAPGERYDLEFVADNPGTWVFHCHVLSHATNKGSSRAV